MRMQSRRTTVLLLAEKAVLSDGRRIPIGAWRTCPKDAGEALKKEGFTGRLDVMLPAASCAYESISVPAANTEDKRALLRLHASRVFAPLGAVHSEAIWPAQGSGNALLVALPSEHVKALQELCAFAKCRLGRLGIIEFPQASECPVVTQFEGQNTLFVSNDSYVTDVVPLGSTEESARQLKVLCLQKGLEKQLPRKKVVWPGEAVLGFDLMRPVLHRPVALWRRRACRLSALSACVILALAGLMWMQWDALWQKERQLGLDLEISRPVVEVLKNRKADVENLDPWFAKRYAPQVALACLSSALPDPKKSEQVRLVRVNAFCDKPTQVEAWASSHQAMMDYVDTLQAQDGVVRVEQRSSRRRSRKSNDIDFELIIECLPMASEKGGERESS